MFPNAVIRDEAEDVGETVDLLVWVVNGAPRAVRNETMKRIQARPWRALLLFGIESRSAEVCSREQWRRWRLSVRSERLVAPVVRAVFAAAVTR